MSQFVEKTRESAIDWMQANEVYINMELRRLRLLIHRRILWLRTQWKRGSLPSYRNHLIDDSQVDTLLTKDDGKAEREFYENDPEAKAIADTMSEIKRELEKHSERLLNAGTPAALDILTRVFGLTPFDRHVLLLCHAPENDPAFERLYAYAQDDITCKYATPHLALSLFESGNYSSYTLMQHFQPDAPLNKFRLMKWKDSADTAHCRATGGIGIDPRISDFLRGFNYPDKRIADLIKPLRPVESLPPSYDSIVNNLRQLMDTGGVHIPTPVMNFTGSAKSGKSDVAFELGKSIGLAFYRLNSKSLHSSGTRWQDILPILRRECMLLPAALYIDATGYDEGDLAKLYLEELLERLDMPFIVGSEDPLRIEREILNVSIPKLSSKEQAMIWEQQLAWRDVSLNGQIDTVVEQFDFESDMISKTIAGAVATIRMQTGKSAKLTIDDLWQSGRAYGRCGMDGRAQRLIPCYCWEDIVLPEEAREQLKDIAAQVSHRAMVYDKWGYGAKLTRGRGISALFSGQSGTGKTMAAEIMADHLKLDLHRIDLSAVVSKYIGETEKNLRKVFDAAEQSGSILFFDEADALFGKRSEVKDSHDRYANIEINYLLQRMEDYRGLAILASNMKSLLDQAFLRRLRFHVEFPFPDANYRRMIWNKVFPPQANVGNLDYNFLVRLRISGGNIKNIALNAAFLAADNGQAIGMEHLLRATKREYDKIRKMVLESEFGSYYDRVKR